MNEIKLSDYVEEYGQNLTAKRLGLTQGAIWQMLKKGRNIFLVEHEDGTIKAYEKKPVGKNHAA